MSAPDHMGPGRTGPGHTGPGHAGADHAGTSRARISALTDVGRTREHNEDAFLVADLATREPLEFPADGAAAGGAGAPAERACDLSGAGVLLVVADGLGGAAAGEVASHLAARVAHEALVRALGGAGRAGGPPGDPSGGPLGGPLGDPAAGASAAPDDAAAALRDAVLAANAAVHQLGAARPELHGMASTITAALLRDDGVTVAQVGDSRAYVVRGGEARQITKDQSLVQRLVDAGEMTPEQAETSLRRNIILQALGPEATVRVDVTRQSLCRGDLVLLCSDGLSGQLRAGELAAQARRTPAPGALCAALVAAANATGGPDNITVVAARVSGDVFAAAPGEEPAEECEPVAPHRVPLEPAAAEARADSAAAAAPATITTATGVPGPRPPGVPRGVLASRRLRVRGVYAVLGAAAVAAAAWTWWAFAR